MPTFLDMQLKCRLFQLGILSSHKIGNLTIIVIEIKDCEFFDYGVLDYDEFFVPFQTILTLFCTGCCYSITHTSKKS